MHCGGPQAPAQGQNCAAPNRAVVTCIDYQTAVSVLKNRATSAPSTQRALALRLNCYSAHKYGTRCEDTATQHALVLFPSAGGPSAVDPYALGAPLYWPERGGGGQTTGGSGSALAAGAAGNSIGGISAICT